MLRSLHIQNFRSLENFSVDKLGRLNLIVGKNNCGKSSVLEALRIYAGNANRALLEAIATEHDEKVRLVNTEIDSEPSYPFESFFTGRQYPQNEDSMIFIGTSPGDPEALTIKHGYLVESEEIVIDPDGEKIVRTVRRPIAKAELPSTVDDTVSQALFISKGENIFRMRFDTPTSRIRNAVYELQPPLPCGVVPTQFVSLDELAEEWDKIVLTQHEDTVRLALRIIDPNFQDLAFVKYGSASSSIRRGTRSARIKLGSVNRPVPLGSMGDGMLRVLQLILKVFSAKGGFLLIDEFENGLHYSVQQKVWELLFDVSIRLDIQVFATTHSWDCIESFAKVSAAKESAEGVLFRVGKSVRNTDRGEVIATVFDEVHLANITQADVEVR